MSIIYVTIVTVVKNSGRIFFHSAVLPLFSIICLDLNLKDLLLFVWKELARTNTHTHAAAATAMNTKQHNRFFFFYTIHFLHQWCCLKNLPHTLWISWRHNVLSSTTSSWTKHSDCSTAHWSCCKHDLKLSNCSGGFHETLLFIKHNLFRRSSLYVKIYL